MNARARQLAVAVAQSTPGGNTAANIDQIREFAAIAAARGASVVVFPEYSNYFTPSPGEDWVEHAEPLDGAFTKGLAGIADHVRVTLVAGMLETTRIPGHVSNTLVAVGPDRGILATYRKQHLYDAFGHRESDWVVPGGLEVPQLFEVGGFQVGMQTCYDIRFPEVSRRLVDAGAELVCVPAQWVRGPLKEHHWRTLVTARAIENTMFIAAADHAPPSGIGNSMFVDPMGVELATIGDDVGVAVAWASGERLAEVREVNPALALRRYRVEPL